MKMTLKQIVFFSLCFAFVVCSSNSRKFTDAEAARKIDEYVGGLVKCRNFMGATLAVVRNGTILLTKGYGLANANRNESVTPNTKFAIASITKSFTGHLTMKLLMEKGISIDSKVKDLWPGFTAWSGYRYNDLTMRDFLAHKTGVPRNDALWVLGGRDRDNLINKIRLLKPDRSPRVSLLYNNLFYLLAGKVTENIADNGEDWESLIEENFFKPIEMENSSFYDRQENYDGFATPYIVPTLPDGTELEPTELPMDTWKNAGIAGPAASIVSTANDMAKWLAMILNKGVALNGKRVLSEEALNRLFAPEIPFNDNIPGTLSNKPELSRRTSYGLGYFNGYKSGVEYHQHGGDLSGFHSTHTLIRSLKSGFFFSSNYAKQRLERPILEDSINAILMDKEPTISLQEACDSPFSEVEDAHSTLAKYVHKIPNYSKLVAHRPKNLNVTKYTGRFENWVYGTVSVKSTGASLFQLSLDYGNIGRYNLLSIDEDTFLGIAKPGPGVIISNVLFNFMEEENGKMKKLETLFEPLDPPIFERGLGPEPPIDHTTCTD